MPSTVSRRAALAVLLLFLAPASILRAQSVPRFRAFREVTKSAAAEVLTIQIPARSSKKAEFASLYIQTDADMDIVVELNGGSATSTAFSPVVVNLPGVSAVAGAFHTSNTAGGSTIDKFHLDGGSTAVFSLSGIVLGKGMSTPQNLTIRTTAFTGTVKIRVEWEER